MFKRIMVLIFVLFWFIWNFTYAEAPNVNCYWLPGCPNTDKSVPSDNVDYDLWADVITSIIWQAIQYVAAIAVITLIISGIMYMLSWWEEEKIKKAKSWIIWSLVWVFLSISAWWIINMINKITIW